LATLLLVVLAGGASAQIEPKWVLIADGELAFVVSGPDNFTDEYSSIGWGGGVGLGAVISRGMMALVTLNYTRVDLDQDGFRTSNSLPSGAVVDGGAVDIIYLSFGGRYTFLKNPPERWKPYVVGGAGWFYIESDDLTISGAATGRRPGGSENAFGVNVGVGSDFPISPTISGFVEVQYQVGFTTDSATATIPVRGGFAFLLGQDQ
jgi:outer membrane autotransporter protein